jgi:hypothetical protein
MFLHRFWPGQRTGKEKEEAGRRWAVPGRCRDSIFDVGEMDVLAVKKPGRKDKGVYFGWMRCRRMGC